MVGIISHHNCMYGYNLSLFCDWKDTTSLFYNLLHSTYILLGGSAALAVVGISKKAYFMEKWGRNTFIVFASHSLFLTYVIKVIMLPLVMILII